MKPILLCSYRGFLVRICHNGASHRFNYEWTIDPITLPAKRAVQQRINELNLRFNQSSHFVKRRTSQRPMLPRSYQRLYDPTSSTSARGSVGALSWAKEAVDRLLSPPFRRPLFYR